MSVEGQVRQCSELVMTGAHFQDHPCRVPATLFEGGKWWCRRHSEAGIERTRRQAQARRRSARAKGLAT